MTFYILAAIFVYVMMVEREAELYSEPLTQRQLLMVVCSAVVWPLLAAGIIFEKRREMIDNLRVLLDLDLDLNSILVDLNPHPEMEEEFDIDPDTL